jgi:hypothetical protein
MQHKQFSYPTVLLSMTNKEAYTLSLRLCLPFLHGNTTVVSFLLPGNTTYCLITMQTVESN